MKKYMLSKNMRKYIYLWINQYRFINGLDESEGFLFDDLGLNLSSEYTVSHILKRGNIEKGEDDELEFLIRCNKDSYDEEFYSDNIKDLKVIVGNNGAGKTTILRLLSDIIAGCDLHDKHVEYVLLYEKNGRIYKQIQIDDIKRNIEKKNYKLEERRELKIKNLESEIYPVSEYVDFPLCIFYSPCFYGNEDVFYKYRDNERIKDISTDALLSRHHERFINPHTDGRRYYGNTDRLACYSMIEQNWLIDFLLNAGKRFFEIIPVPHIKMEISDQAIDAAISDLAVYHHKKYNLYELICRDMDGEERKYWKKQYEDAFEKWRKEVENLPHYTKKKPTLEDFNEEFEYDKDSFIRSIKKCWRQCYDAISRIEDSLRFVALMSYFRTFNSNGTTDTFHLNVCLADINPWKSLKDIPVWKQNVEFEGHIQENDELKKIKHQIESIIDILIANPMRSEGSSVFFDIKKDKSALKEINDIYQDIYKLTDFITFSITRPMSSGENQFVRFYARLYGVLKDVDIHKPVGQIYLFIDEADLYMHPEWQRKWLDVFLELLNSIEEVMWTQYDKNNRDNKPPSERITIMSPTNKLKIQLFLATHSPFMLTDFKGDNIIKLQREKDKNGNRLGKVVCVNEKINSFAGNIYDILKEGFFLEGTLGYRTEKKLKDLIRNIEKGVKYSETLISQIGDPILKALILQKKGCSNDKNKN